MENNYLSPSGDLTYDIQTAQRALELAESGASMDDLGNTLPSAEEIRERLDQLLLELNSELS